MNIPSDLHFMQNENIYLTLIKESLAGVGLYVGPRLVIEVANQAIIDIYGKGNDIIGKAFFDVLPELRYQDIYRIVNDIYTTGVAYEAKEGRLELVKNGELQVRFFNFSFKPLKDDAGQVWAVLNTATEVTELVTMRQKLAESKLRSGFIPEAADTVDMRKELAAQQALVESERFLQNITLAAPISLWMSDEKGNLTYANHTWGLWTGMSNEQILGTGWLDALVEEDRQHTSTKFWADVAARRYYEVNFRILNKDGDVRWCIATGTPQYNADGNFIGYIGACTDITEKTLVEHQLKLKNDELNDQIKQFEFVTAFMPVQLWTSTIDGNLDYVNQRTIDYFGSDDENLLGPGWILHVHPDDREECITAWLHSLRTGDAYQFEFRLRGQNGQYRWHLARALPFYNDGKVVKWFGTNTDIDEQKQLERQKDDFLGIASHELKTPVTSIKAYAQVLSAMLTKDGEDKKAHIVERMDAQIDRLTNLIGDLLDVTKINSGKIQFNKTWFDFDQAVAETVADLQHTSQKHTLIGEFGQTGKIFSDKDRISQVITNLITNAIKYSPHADKVIIKTWGDDNEVNICVRDFGIGIPADKTEKVFEQFYRVSGSKQHTFPGLGLGLYISAEIITREGGKMWVDSVEGKGSDFCFSLPVNNELPGS